MKPLLSDDESTHDPGLQLEVCSGRVRIAAGTSEGTAELSWTPGAVTVSLFDEVVEGSTCRVSADAFLRATANDKQATVVYHVRLSRDRMNATLRIEQIDGIRRTIRDCAASHSLRLQVDEELIPAPEPTIAGAQAELQRAGVVYGNDADAIATAVQDIGTSVVVATGLEPIEGRSGYLEPLVDMEELRHVGVLAGTPLVRRIRKRDGAPGRDITGRELAVPAVRDVRLQPGPGVEVDDQQIMAVAAIDGAPSLSDEGRVEIRHELVLEVVDTVSGDITFNGSIRIEGDVGEARKVTARDQLTIEGNVDRARLVSGGSMLVHGSIMSSVIQAGGERAVAATIADRILPLPSALGLVSAQARQLRDVVTAKGRELSYALSLQLVLEGKHRGLLPSLLTVVQDLREAGPAHCDVAERAATWHRQLSTAANLSLTTEQYMGILTEATALASDVERALEQRADLTVTYMQASEAEATGEVTLRGRGIFNSRVVAWGGLVAHQADAVFRGGSIMSHGLVQVREVGSPAGARTKVQLSASGSLRAARTLAGTVIQGPGYTHRFAADRSDVCVHFDERGSMNVESLAA